MVPTVNAVKLMATPSALVKLISLVQHRTAVPNASLVQIVHKILLVKIKNALILALALAGLRHVVKLSITMLHVPAQRAIQEILSVDVLELNVSMCII